MYLHVGLLICVPLLVFTCLLLAYAVLYCYQSHIKTQRRQLRCKTLWEGVHNVSTVSQMINDLVSPNHEANPVMNDLLDDNRIGFSRPISELIEG